MSRSAHFAVTAPYAMARAARSRIPPDGSRRKPWFMAAEARVTRRQRGSVTCDSEEALFAGLFRPRSQKGELGMKRFMARGSLLLAAAALVTSGIGIAPAGAVTQPGVCRQ